LTACARRAVCAGAAACLAAWCLPVHGSQPLRPPPGWAPTGSCSSCAVRRRTGSGSCSGRCRPGTGNRRTASVGRGRDDPMSRR